MVIESVKINTEAYNALLAKDQITYITTCIYS